MRIYKSTMEQKDNFYVWLRTGMVLLMTVAFMMSLMAGEVTAVTPVQLTTANRDQYGAYFNDNYAPQWGDESCISGCVATVMAEVMRYHKWPLVGRGSHY